MRNYGYFFITLVLLLAVAVGGCQLSESSEPAPASGSDQSVPIEPHPMTQSPEKLVTHEQMLEWEQEMKN